METISYYDLHAHREQHARILSSLYHAVPKESFPDCVYVHEILCLLPQWFLEHFIKMDAVLIKALDAAGSAPVPHSCSVAM